MKDMPESIQNKMKKALNTPLSKDQLPNQMQLDFNSKTPYDERKEK